MKGMGWWDRAAVPMRRVRIGIATGVRKTGLTRLRQEVMTCEYEDVQVMWEMLSKTRAETEMKRRSCREMGWGYFRWGSFKLCFRGI